MFGTDKIQQGKMQEFTSYKRSYAIPDFTGEAADDY